MTLSGSSLDFCPSCQTACIYTVPGETLKNKATVVHYLIRAFSNFLASNTPSEMWPLLRKHHTVTSFHASEVITQAYHLVIGMLISVTSNLLGTLPGQKSNQNYLCLNISRLALTHQGWGFDCSYAGN